MIMACNLIGPYFILEIGLSSVFVECPHAGLVQSNLSPNNLHVFHMQIVWCQGNDDEECHNFLMQITMNWMFLQLLLQCIN